MTGRNPAYVTGEIKVSCCSKLGYRGNPGIKVNSNATVPLARSWSCRSWHYSTVMGAPMDFCRKQYIFLDKGAKAPASASIDAHGPLLKISKYRVRKQQYKKYSHGSDKVAT
jgi:hypothetical protein